MKHRAAALVVALAFAAPAAATPTELDLSLKVDLPLLGLGLAGTLAPEFGKSAWAPRTCRWCHGQPDAGVDVNGFDRAIREGFVGAFGAEPVTWAKTSDLFTYALLPVASAALDLVYTWDGKPNLKWGADVAIVAEAVFLATGFNQAIKFAAGRQRPFVAFDAPHADTLRRNNETSADDNLSFFSGHSTVAASVTVGMARTIELRTGSRIGYWTLMPLGVATGLMRLGADKHWGSDVIVGLLVGTAVGWLVPTLHARFGS